MSEEWRVYVVRPRPSGKEGRNFTLVAQPPDLLRKKGVKPLRKSAGSHLRPEADSGAERWARTLNSSILPDRDPLAVDVLDKHIAWRETATDGSRDTLVAYQQAARRLRPLLGSLRASEVTRPELLKARDALRLTLGPGTVQQTLNCLSGAWRWALDREWVGWPLPAIGRLKAPDTEKRPLERHELEAMLGWVAGYQGGYWLPLFTLLADAGSRISETLRLQAQDVDLRAGVIRLRGKGNRARVVPVPASTLAMLPVRAPGAYVFHARRAGCRKGKPLHRRVPLGIMWRAAEACLPDPDRVDLHSFRRTWISDAHEAGVPMLVSMRVTGHTSTAVHVGYARRAVLDQAKATRLVREGRGARPWERTAETPQRNPAQADPKSIDFPRESLARESCWSVTESAQPTFPLLLDFDEPAQELTPNTADRAGVASVLFCGGHPLGARMEALFRQDGEVALALVLDPIMREGALAYAQRAGLIQSSPSPTLAQASACSTTQV